MLKIRIFTKIPFIFLFFFTHNYIIFTKKVHYFTKIEPKLKRENVSIILVPIDRPWRDECKSYIRTQKNLGLGSKTKIHQFWV